MRSNQAELLLHYMPLIVRSGGISDWERKFCASMIHKNRTGRFSPSEKQIGVMQRLVDQFKADTAETIDDGR